MEKEYSLTTNHTTYSEKFLGLLDRTSRFIQSIFSPSTEPEDQSDPLVLRETITSQGM